MAFGMNSLLRPPTSAFSKRDLWSSVGEERVYGVLFEPRNNRGASPAVICAHSFGGSFRDTTDFAEAMARAGYVAIAVDFRGGSSRSMSDGEVADASVATMAADLEAVLDVACGQRCVDRHNVYLMGQGEGAVAAMRIALARPKDIRGLVLCYPSFNLHDLMVGDYGTSDTVPDSINLWQIAGRAYGVDALENDPFQGMSAYTGRTLLFHGDSDKITPLKYSERAAELLPNARLEVLSNGGHGFNGANERRVFEESANMIRATRAKGAAAAA